MGVTLSMAVRRRAPRCPARTGPWLFNCVLRTVEHRIWRLAAGRLAAERTQGASPRQPFCLICRDKCRTVCPTVTGGRSHRVCGLVMACEMAAASARRGGPGSPVDVVSETGDQRSKLAGRQQRACVDGLLGELAPQPPERPDESLAQLGQHDGGPLVTGGRPTAECSLPPRACETSA